MEHASFDVFFGSRLLRQKLFGLGGFGTKLETQGCSNVFHDRLEGAKVLSHPSLSTLPLDSRPSSAEMVGNLGSKDSNSALGPKYHYSYSIWVLKPNYLGPLTQRGNVGSSGFQDYNELTFDDDTAAPTASNLLPHCPQLLSAQPFLLT